MEKAPTDIAESATSSFVFKRRATLAGDLRRFLKRQMRLRLQRLLHSHPLRLPLFWAATVLGMIWAAPLTLFGLLVGLPVVLFRGHLQLVRGHTITLLARGPIADWILNRHPFGPMNAMALGHVVIAERRGLSSRVLVHKLTHVRQASRWGPFFPFAYLASSIWAFMRGRDAYWHNRFEIAARKAEKHF
ncbi:hypothetical protein [Noviherbaspirillum sp.]|uniref:hypothetical protein n=1 Tax=Noviherbaspirillum sp. TaxID=1926288 RepID=UPI002B45B461|nr:hypothetical protein [Noviherbaspirillum sp.]HJV81136.1 hypothetical protein [Noviherbaspirillum sp.]